MTAFTLRIDDTLIQNIDELAKLHGFKTRNKYIEHLLQQAVIDGFTPTQTGDGYIAKAPSGGSLSLTKHDGFVSSGATNLNEDEQTLYQEIKTMAEQGQWQQVRHTLLRAGFTIKYVSIS